MRLRRQSGLTLLELLVVVSIIGVLTALLVPAVQEARAAVRRTVCADHLRQLTLAVQLFDGAQGELPGYVNAIGPQQRKLVGWSVMVFPYLEQRELWDTWQTEPVGSFESCVLDLGESPFPTAYVDVLVCPSINTSFDNPTSYVGNTGLMEFVQPAIDHQSNNGNRANGVFPFRGNTPGVPLSRVDLGYINGQDGMTHTLMLGETLGTQRWAWLNGCVRAPICVLMPFTFEEKLFYGFSWHDGSCMDCGAMQCCPPTQAVTSARRSDECFVRHLSSLHAGGANASFCGGRVRFLSEGLDYKVYRQLMTSSGDASNDPDNVLLDDGTY